MDDFYLYKRLILAYNAQQVDPNEPIMKYHLLPTPNKFNLQKIEGLSKIIKQSATDLISETILAVKKMSKREPNNCSPSIYFLHDEHSMDDLMRKLQADDEIIIHGEGQPFVIGLDVPSPFDIHGQSLAKLFKANQMPDIQINIVLLSCLSASTYAPSADIDINFARDMSKALNSFGYQNVTVTGYTGFVVVKNSGKYSVSSILEKSTTGTHASLKDAQMVYLNGDTVIEGRILTKDISNKAYDWAQDYIKNAILGQQETLMSQQSKEDQPKQPTPLTPSFFRTSNKSESCGDVPCTSHRIVTAI